MTICGHFHRIKLSCKKVDKYPMQTQCVLIVLHKKRQVRETPLWPFHNNAHREKTLCIVENIFSILSTIDRVFRYHTEFLRVCNCRCRKI